MILSDIAVYVNEYVSSSKIALNDYVTTDNILQDKAGRTIAVNLPPNPVSLVKYRTNDILIANIRPYLKKIWFADNEGGASNDVLVFRAKENVNPLYLYAVLLNDSFYEHIMKAPRGAKMPRGDKEHIMRYPISDVKNTDGIGNWVEHLDRKIALNRRMNSTLEAMAKQLYDYWFVQFDFPDENGRPYKSSGGKMVWNEKLKREIPEGWGDSCLIDIANITMGQSPDGSSYNEIGEGTIFYQGSTDFGLRFPSVRMYTTSPTRYANKGDILMSVRAPVGTTNIANTDCCIGRGLSAINSKIGSITYIYFNLVYLKSKFDNINSVGTTFGAITKDDLHSLPVIKPTDEIISKYEALNKPIFDKQMNIGYEIEHLTSLRNYLLPLLMNGQVKIKD